MTTAFIVSLSLFVLIFAIRIWHMSGVMDELEIRVLKLEQAWILREHYKDHQQRVRCSNDEHTFADFEGHILCKFCGASKP